MYNWSTDEKSLKPGTRAHAIWSLEQKINFGLGGEKINVTQLRSLLPNLNLDPARKRFLELLIN